MKNVFAIEHYLVFSPEEPTHAALCRGWAEATLELANSRDMKRMRVWRVTLDEFSRDVTSDFIPDEPVDICAGFDPDRAYDRREWA